MPMNYYYGFDYTWYLLVLPAFLLALWAQLRVKTTYAKYSKIRSVRGRTAAEVARQILNDHGLTYVRVDQIAGELTDNYDPRTNVVHLSQGVYNSTSIAAIGVAAHECGHAVQHAEEYGPLRLRSAIIPVTNIALHPHLFCGITAEFHPADEHRHPAVRAGDAVPAHHPSGRIQCQPAGACHHRGTRAAHR